jgi:hypothetical protein
MADEASPGPSARDRRRERAKAKPSDAAGRTFKRYRVHLVIVLLFGAIITVMAVNAQNGSSCPGHWHASQDVYVNGERVSYAHPKYDLSGSRQNGGSMSVSAHMHQNGGDFLWHFEPPVAKTCIPYERALDVVDTDLSEDRLVLDGAHEQLGLSGTFEVDDEHQLRAYHKVGEGGWQDISIGSLLRRQLVGDERVLIVYGNETGSALDPFKQVAEGHSIEGSSGGGGKDSLVPAFGVGLLGLAVLGVWHAMSKKA